MISKRAKARILDLIESGVQEGAKLELDGRDIQVPGFEQGEGSAAMGCSRPVAHTDGPR